MRLQPLDSAESIGTMFVDVARTAADRDALPDAVDASCERARRVFAWFVLGFAAATVINVAGFWPDWLFRWQVIAGHLVPIVANVMMAVGAITMLRGREDGIVAVRWSAFAYWCVGVLSVIVWRLSMKLPVSPGLSDGVPFLTTTARMLHVNVFDMPGLVFCLSFPLRRRGR